MDVGEKHMKTIDDCDIHREMFKLVNSFYRKGSVEESVVLVVDSTRIYSSYYVVLGPH